MIISWTAIVPNIPLSKETSLRRCQTVILLGSHVWYHKRSKNHVSVTTNNYNSIREVPNILVDKKPEYLSSEHHIDALPEVETHLWSVSISLIIYVSFTELVVESVKIKELRCSVPFVRLYFTKIRKKVPVLSKLTNPESFKRGLPLQAWRNHDRSKPTGRKPKLSYGKNVSHSTFWTVLVIPCPYVYEQYLRQESRFPQFQSVARNRFQVGLLVHSLFSVVSCGLCTGASHLEQKCANTRDCENHNFIVPPSSAEALETSEASTITVTTLGLHAL